MKNLPSVRTSLPNLSPWGSTFDRLFQDMWDRASEAEKSMITPVLDIAETESSLHVAVELPGMEKNDIDLQVKDGYLVLRGEKSNTSETHEGKVLRRERRFGSFYRALALPDAVDTESIAATFRNGILGITIQKREESKPRVITVSD